MKLNELPEVPFFEFSLVIPCLNEERTIGICIQKAKEFFVSRKIAAQIIIADNGSSDNSVLIAKNYGGVVVHIVEKGYGSALHGGIMASNSRYIVMGDGDDSYDFSSLDNFIINLREGADLVMGNRFQGIIEDGAMPYLHRIFGNPFFSWLGRFLFDTKIGDINCGLRGFSRSAYLDMNMCSRGMEFAVEMVIKMSLFERRVAEVPVSLFKDGRNRAPHLRTWRDGWRTLRFMLLLSPWWVFQFPAMIILGFGVPFTFLLCRGPLRIGYANFDIHSLLLVAMLIPLGVQILSCGLFARIFSESRGLLPRRRRRFSSFIDSFSFEGGVFAAFFILLLGACFIVEPTYQWASSSFAALDPQNIMRQVIPGIILIITSVQILFTGFVISILKLPLAVDKVS